MTAAGVKQPFTGEEVKQLLNDWKELNRRPYAIRRRLLRDA